MEYGINAFEIWKKDVVTLRLSYCDFCVSRHEAQLKKHIKLWADD